MLISRSAMRVVLLLLLLSMLSARAYGFRQVCYLTEWSAVRRGAARFSPDDVDPALCTHVVYAYGPQVAGHLLQLTPSQHTVEVYARLNAHKTTNPALKTLIAIGEWNFRSSRMVAILSTATTRRNFVRSAISFLKTYDFNGVDLHFVHPVTRSRALGSKVKFTKLCKDLRAAFTAELQRNGRQYLLVVSGPAERKYIDGGYEVANVSRLVDFINLLTFDFHGGWEDQTGHHSPLFPGKRDAPRDARLSVEWAVDYWVRRGAARHQLVVGMPLYGRGFTLADPTCQGLGAPASGPSFPGRRTAQGGLLAYYEVCQLLRGGATRHWMKDQGVPYMTLGSQWVGYDDRASLTLKVRWLREQQLGGWMAWSLDYDDVTGRHCQLGRYPLLTAMANALHEPLVQTIINTSPPSVIMATPEVNTFNIEVFCVSRPDGTYPYPGDCSRYVECAWEMGVVRHCRAPLVYDIEWKQCISNPFAFGC